MNRKRKTQIIALNAVTLSIITVFTFVSVPGIGGLAIVPLVLLSVIVSSIFGGWQNAIFSSVAMGVLSLIKNFTMPTMLSPAFQNPLISVLPRLLIGLSVLGTYRLVRFLTRRASNEYIRETVSLTAAGIVGPVINTGLVFLMIWVCFGNSVLGDKTTAAWFLLLVSANFPWEIGICTGLTAPILLALKKAMKTNYLRPVRTKKINIKIDIDVAEE